MKESGKRRWTPAEAAIHRFPSQDSRPVRVRLSDYARRGVEEPESLGLAEIRQMAFALSLYLSLDEDDPNGPPDRT